MKLISNQGNNQGFGDMSKCCVYALISLMTHSFTSSMDVSMSAVKVHFTNFDSPLGLSLCDLQILTND